MFTNKRLNIPDADFFYFANFLSASDVFNLYKHLNSLPLQQEKVYMFGKTILAPRFVALFGNKDYMYGGINHKSLPMTDTIAQLQASVNSFLDTEFNSVLINFYRDGRDFINFHVDNEPSLGYNPHVASVSIGTARSFSIKNIVNRQEHSLILESGSLLLMGNNSQINYLHALPKSKSKLPRFNITLRRIL